VNTIKVIAIFCLLPTFLFGQNSVDENGLRQGTWSKKWENGKTRYKGQFEDDKAVGVFYYWYADGNPQSILSYIGKGHIAHCKIYGVDGNIAAKGKYIDQMKDSTWLYYDYQGRLRTKNNYNEGLMEGEQVTYSYKGKIVEIINYYDDKKQKSIKYKTPKITKKTVYEDKHCYDLGVLYEILKFNSEKHNGYNTVCEVSFKIEQEY